MSADDPLIGTLVADRYRVVRKLGEGGMGVVYQAVHEALRKPVALKLLASSGRIDREAVARFEREAIAAANLRHPNIAEATDFGRLPDGALYLIMEYVEGTTLRRLLREQRRLPPERALVILEQVASALSTAHAREVVHRDLKPENIIVTSGPGKADFVKVIDFGIARIRNATFGGGATGLTKAGTVFGTPDYMAPEQVMGQPVDARADQYALGVLAFELLTGKPPFAADDIGQLMMMHVGAPIPSTRERDPSLPIAADAVIMKMLGKLPDDRFASVDDAMRALSAAFAPASVASSPGAMPISGPASLGPMSGGPASSPRAPNAAPPPPASHPGRAPASNATVRLGPQAGAGPSHESMATEATLRSFAFDASYASTPPGATAVLSPPSMSGAHVTAPPMSVPHAGPVSGRQPAPAVTGPHAATSGSYAAATTSGSHPAATTSGPHPAAPGTRLTEMAQSNAVTRRLPRRPPVWALAAAAVSLIGVVILIVVLVRAIGGGGSVPSEVTAALADWKSGKVGPASSVLKTAIASDPDLANDADIARTLAESVGDEAAYDKLAELLQTTPLGRSSAMASALAAMAMKDNAGVRDPALELLRPRQDLLTRELASRVRLRDAEDCDELEDAKREETEVATNDTLRDLERIVRDDCKRMLRQKELCERCRGGGPGIGGGPGGGKGKGKKDKKKGWD